MKDHTQEPLTEELELSPDMLIILNESVDSDFIEVDDESFDQLLDEMIAEARELNGQAVQ